MLEVNGRTVYATTEVNGENNNDWDDLFCNAYVDYAEWADTGVEFTEAEYDEHEEFLNSVAGELHWESMV